LRNLQNKIIPHKPLDGELNIKRSIPDFPDKDRWYHPKVLSQLGIIKALIDDEEDVVIRDFFTVCFSSILKTCSSQEEDFSYIADNMKPREQRNINVYRVFENKLRSMIQGAIDFYKIRNPLCSSRVIGSHDARDLSFLDSNSVDLIVTSPPYAFTTDYTKMFRLSFYWLGWDIEKWKKDEIGARWKRGRKDAVKEYFNELETCFREMYRVLKNGAYCCVVIGDSERKKETIRTVDTLLKINSKISIAKFCKKIVREISGSGLPFQSVTKESILIFKKT
jgi:hypothetical protein